MNDQGLDEAGVDGGGVFKEYMDLLSKQAFSTLNFFLENEDAQRRLYPNPYPVSALAFVEGTLVCPDGSIYLFMYFSINRSIDLSISLSIDVSFYLFLYRSIY